MTKYGVVSGPYFPIFGLNTEKYSVSLRIKSEFRKIRTRNNSVFGHFPRSDWFSKSVFDLNISASGNWTETLLKTYFVKQGKEYRFRVIHAGAIFPLRVSIDGHSLKIVATDGYDVKP